MTAGLAVREVDGHARPVTSSEHSCPGVLPVVSETMVEQVVAVEPVNWAG